MDLKNPKIDPKALPELRAEMERMGFLNPPSIGGKSVVVLFRLLSVIRSAGLSKMEAVCAVDAAKALLPDVCEPVDGGEHRGMDLTAEATKEWLRYIDAMSERYRKERAEALAMGGPMPAYPALSHSQFLEQFPA